MTTVPQPTADTRWRCTLCGNLTRFDVTRSSKVVEYVHLDLAGEPKVEEREVVSETIESVRCRWCNAVDQIELVDRPGRRDAPEGAARQVIGGVTDGGAAASGAEPAAAADGDPAEVLDRPLPEGVRRRVVALVSDAFGGLTVAELPAQLRQYARFTPTRRAKFAGNAMAAALESDPLFRQRIGERLKEAQPELAGALEAGSPPAGRRSAWTWRPPPMCCAPPAG